MPIDRSSYRQLQVLNSPDTIQQAIIAANLTYDTPTEEFSGLDFASPHVPDNFVWGAPPVDDSDLSIYSTQNNFSPIGSVTLSLKVLGTQITLGTFPQAQRVASVLFNSNSGLLSADLIIAFNNLSADGELGIYIAKDVGPVIGVATSSDVYDGLLAPLGQFCKRSGVSFSLDIAPLIKQNTSVALYAVGYGANLATSSMAVTALLRYAVLDG